MISFGKWGSRLGVAILASAGFVTACTSTSGQTLSARASGSTSATTRTTLGRVRQGLVSRQDFPPKDGTTVVANRDGNPVGYVETSRFRPSSPDTQKATNARTMLPVTDANGTLVGYWAFAVGFVSMNVATQPGFDIEDYRAQLYDGCEPQIGSGAGEKYPLCPPAGGSEQP